MDPATSPLAGWCVALASLTGHAYPYLVRLKGTIPMPTIALAEVKTAFEDFQGFIKLLAPLAPGSTPQEKAAHLDRVIDPVVDKWLSDRGASAEAVALVNTGIDWVITAELSAVTAA